MVPSAMVRIPQLPRDTKPACETKSEKFSQSEDFESLKPGLKGVEAPKNPTPSQSLSVTENLDG